MALYAPRVAWRGCARGCERSLRLSGFQSRCFTATAPQHGQVLAFPPTSSTELDDVLSTIRMKIILPSYLPASDRKKLVRPRYAKKLANNPIQMEVDGETVQFHGWDPTKGEVPNARKILFEAIDKMETRDDWAQLSPLLEGLHSYADKTLHNDDYPKITRKAGLKGQVSVILECAHRVKRTGFKLDTLEKIDSLMCWILANAADHPQQSSAVEKALRWVEDVLVMAELPEHQPKSRSPEGPRPKFPLYRDPQLLATPLLLTSALALMQHGGEAVEKKVVRYAEDFVALWPEDTTLRQLHPAEDTRKDRTQTRYLHHPIGYLQAASPVLNALRLAIQVVEPRTASLAKKLAARRDVLDEEFTRVIAEQPEGIGAQFHRKLSQMGGAPGTRGGK